MIDRRMFLASVAGTAAGLAVRGGAVASTASPMDRPGVRVGVPRDGEGLFAYVARSRGSFDATVYKQLLGAANEFKEGDQILGISAVDDASRRHARQLLGNTRLTDLDRHPVHDDDLHHFIAGSVSVGGPAERALPGTLGQLREFLLRRSEAEILSILPALSSQAIGCVVKLMSNRELVEVGAKIFHPLPGSKVGARGYLGARIQPNSPTDHVDDILWQVFDGWAYATGDVLLGTNPVSSTPASVAAIEGVLRDALEAFGLQDTLPHCVLSHIDVQAEVETADPGSTALWFQSIAGTDGANATFDISVEKMQAYAQQRTGRFGLYFETGQGADATNGHGEGFDMVLHEARKYGFARRLQQTVGATQQGSGSAARPWVHLNDVAGFIGPEVFRTREQLVRCCLEDIVMGKLHGLTIGLDVCSTLHMDVSLDDLDWCLDQILPASPAYLMALPTKIDPMLGYLTTGFQDHVRLREKFGYRVDDRMAEFFRRLGVIDDQGRPTEHFGDPLWVHLQYRRRKGDERPEEEIRREGRSQVEEVRGRGVFLAEGHGEDPWQLSPRLAQEIQRIYADGKESIWAELTPTFLASVPNHIPLATQSIDREDYILHPESGEELGAASLERLRELRGRRGGAHDVQFVISDGLNALSIVEPDQVLPFLAEARRLLEAAGLRPAPENLVVTSGRVRAGYQIGETLFGGLAGRRVLLHLIGERPGTGHRTFSVYMTAPDGEVWGRPGAVDHNITKVVSGIALTAQAPRKAAAETVQLLESLV